MAMWCTVVLLPCRPLGGPWWIVKLLAVGSRACFEWLACWRVRQCNIPPSWRANAMLYDSLTIPAIYLCLLLGLMMRGDGHAQVSWIHFLSALATSRIAIVLPAYGPFEIFGLLRMDGFCPTWSISKSSGAWNQTPVSD